LVNQKYWQGIYYVIIYGLCAKNSDDRHRHKGLQTNHNHCHKISDLGVFFSNMPLFGSLRVELFVTPWRYTEKLWLACKLRVLDFSWQTIFPAYRM
jgi:hypothetical protein